MKRPEQEARLSRRDLILLMAAGVGSPALADSFASSFILVASPPDAGAALWGRRLRAPLSERLLGSSGLALHFAGAADGVTGANQFDAQVAPDGQTALLAPGAASLAWLSGDSRVHYDPGSWIPTLLTTATGVVVARDPDLFAHPRPGLRIACKPQLGACVAGMLAAELVGGAPVPVRVDDLAGAVRSGAADACYLLDAGLPALAAHGLFPILSAGIPGAGREERRAGAAVPTLAELRPSGRALHRAWNAVSAASTIATALVLPLLSPADRVAQWRNAVGDPGVQDAARLAGARIVLGSAAQTHLSATLIGGDTQLVLRKWLARRMGWQPG